MTREAREKGQQREPNFSYEVANERPIPSDFSRGYERNLLVSRLEVLDARVRELTFALEHIHNISR